jgi:hypothetical protein
VDAIGGTNVLAQEAERHLGDRQGVRGVHSALREGGGVGRFAGVADLKVRIGERYRGDVVRGAGMDHHRGMHAGKGPTFEQQDLSATAHLFGRRADDVYR